MSNIYLLDSAAPEIPFEGIDVPNIVIISILASIILAITIVIIIKKVNKKK